MSLSAIKKLASKFGVEKSLIQTLELTDDLLIKCQFIDAPPTIEETKILSTNEELEDIFNISIDTLESNLKGLENIFQETIESTLDTNTIFTDNLNSDGESNNSTSPQSDVSSPKYIPDEIHIESLQKFPKNDLLESLELTPSSEHNNANHHDQSEEKNLEEKNNTDTKAKWDIDDIPAELRNALKSFKEYSKKQENILQHVKEAQELFLRDASQKNTEKTTTTGTHTEKTTTTGTTPEVLNYSYVQSPSQNDYINSSQSDYKYNTQIPTARFQPYMYSGFTYPVVNATKAAVAPKVKRPRGRPKRNSVTQDDISNVISRFYSLE